MITLRLAFRDYLNAITISKKACLCWNGKTYIVNWWFSKELCKKLGWEVIHG